MQPKSRTNLKKVMQKLRNQTMQYYEGWTLAEKNFEKRDVLFKHSVDLLVDIVKAKKVVENKPPIIQEVIKEVVKEVIVEIPIDREVIRKIEIEVPKIVEIIREVPKEIIKEVAVPYPIDNPETIKKYETKIKLQQLSKKALERRYNVALTQARASRTLINTQHEKKYKQLATYAYVSIPLVLTQILTWIIL